MSYVFLPPRTSNFFPGGPPYLSGLGFLGDYASDLVAYKEAYRKWEIDNKKWHAEKKAYDQALVTYKEAVTKADANYVLALMMYQKNKKAWDAEAATYAVAINAWGRAFSEMKAANTEKSKQIATTFKLSLPQSYFDKGACISQADHDYFVRNCTVVKGLGGPTAYGSECGMKRLPVCNIPTKPTLSAQPVYPKKPVYPAKPTLRAAPVQPVAPVAPPPAVVTTPVVTTTPVPVSKPPLTTPVTTADPPVLVADEPKQSNLVMGGLIVAAVLGGGYLVYRTLKKPKAQAA